MLLYSNSVSQTFFPVGTTKIIFHIPRNPCLWKRKENQETVRSARKLLQNCQLPNKNPPRYFEVCWELSEYVIILINFTIFRGTPYDVLWNPSLGNVVLKLINVPSLHQMKQKKVNAPELLSYEYIIYSHLINTVNKSSDGWNRTWHFTQTTLVQQAHLRALVSVPTGAQNSRVKTQARRSMNRGLMPGRNKTLFFSPKRRDRLWGPQGIDSAVAGTQRWPGIKRI